MSHKTMILSWLQSGNSITQRQACKKPFFCYRLGARIHDPRNAGHNSLTVEQHVYGLVSVYGANLLTVTVSGKLVYWRQQ